MRGDEKIKVGGQAVIEGVMMRAPGGYAVAVRKQSGEIVFRRNQFRSLSERLRLFRMPILRGFVVLYETLGLGISALNFSADVAMEEEAERQQADKTADKTADKAAAGPKSRPRFLMPLVILFALALGILLFFYLPLLLTSLITGDRGSLTFNIVDGLIRILFFFLYLVGITLLPDVKRLFQYHGAEHKSIYCYEVEGSLSVERASRYSRLHGRCGTSFLLIVLVVAIVIFSVLDSFMFDVVGLPPSRLIRFAIHLALLPLVAGLAYEFTRWAGKASDSRFRRALIWPGLLLQRLTTREPDRSQLEVALVALREALSDPALTIQEATSTQIVHRGADSGSATTLTGQ
ncbi:hypothetical protein AMJ39_02970 [candidate division TA06 bacterium DG_24]|uniref:Metal-dependent enzyme n=1 Tax=candidate division TA06 bacterium DG_24 TaxID=1703770 RepID=A0A0S7WUN9_UNCT6|nr:MAG: hypothetical protein AMJ39_02970 [candidate division TA06 bacterium DG_24]